MDTSFEGVIAAVGNFGFPLVLAVYLLIRFEKRIENLTEAINHLKEVIKK
ncbi:MULTISPECIES: YvrJ family protein [Bacillus]|nr:MULTISPECIES: YvrJ family protein [Bacillus]MCY8636629.1 YvrJ family protein [Bacillus sp. S17B2]MBT3123391.1 YvrJ family protein [Bacillus inaquosorum]MCB4341358.1 hypothetical protein [Bacillus subtilis]MCB5337130.1 putative protein YvrJ [Bacillus amyloliquefaciens]MCF7615461.1 YvrJ family protein [Bacillus subtilis]